MALGAGTESPGLRWPGAIFSLLVCFVACAPLDLDSPAAFVSFSPAARGASRRATLEVTFDQPLLPESVHRGTVALVSGSTFFALSVEADPTLPGLRARRLGGFPLEADIEYELRVDGVRSLDGLVSEPLQLRFRTGESSAPEETQAVTWTQAKAVFDAHCVDCHFSTDVLDLSSGEGVRRTAIGVTAAGREFRSPERGLSGLEVISLLGGVGRPGYSYLLYTLIRDPHLLGGAMPPSGPLDPEEIEILVGWIRSGAPTE